MWNSGYLQGTKRSNTKHLHAVDLTGGWGTHVNGKSTLGPFLLVMAIFNSLPDKKTKG